MTKGNVMTVSHGVFSSKQQALLRRMDGMPSIDSVGYGQDQRFVLKRGKSYVAHVYEGADPDEILVLTTLADPSHLPKFPDLVDLGPVGRHLHSFSAGDPYPTQAMILPRHRLAELVANRLGEAEVSEANRIASERASRAAAPAP